MQKIIKAIVSFILAGLMTMPVYAANNYDMKRKSYVTANQLESSLRGDLKEYADTFIECEHEYGVNAIYLPSIAALESGWGKSELAQNKNNIFGWKQKDGKYKSFDDVDECIEHVAKTLSEQYLDDMGAYYSGGTDISDIADYYSASDDWTNAVCDIAKKIEERCNSYEETAPEFHYGSPIK